MDKSKIQGLIAEKQTRAPYKHACKGHLTERVERANTEPYSCFSFRSNARWFAQQTADGKTVHVANTMFDPAELRDACATLAEAGVDRVEIAIFAGEIPGKPETVPADAESF